MYIFFSIIAIIILFSDLNNPHATKLSFAAAFLFCAIVAFKNPSDYVLQLTSFVAFSILFSCLIRVVLNKELEYKSKEKKLKNFVDKEAIVIKDIGKTLSIDGLGCIEFEGETWSAKSIDDKLIKAGSRVKIVSKENKIMNVKVL